MDRYWFLTWTTYGTWLPGDPRGSVTTLRNNDSSKTHFNRVGTDYAPTRPNLQKFSSSNLSAPPVWLTTDQGICVLNQVRETIAYRSWQTIAIAVMSNHAHVVLGVPGDPDPEKLLGDVKAYATRALNLKFGRQRWWTESGSKRKLPDADAILATRNYVRDQFSPLALFVPAWDDFPEVRRPQTTSPAG